MSITQLSKMKYLSKQNQLLDLVCEVVAFVTLGDDAKTRHSVGKFRKAGFMFSSLHFAEELECRLIDPTQRQFWIGMGA